MSILKNGIVDFHFNSNKAPLRFHISVLVHEIYSKANVTYIYVHITYTDNDK